MEKSIREILEHALQYIPNDCEYARVVNAVMKFYDEHPENWRDCFNYIFENFGYDKYPGNCPSYLMLQLWFFLCCMDVKIFRIRSISVICVVGIQIAMLVM